MNQQELRQYLEQAGLSRVVEPIMKLARPTIRVHTRPLPEAEIPPGVSKMGGLPDLPAEFTYPRWHEPMRFIGQFNLASTRKFDREGLLPDHGLLSFFYETDGEPLHSEQLMALPLNQALPREEARKGWRVLYFEDNPTTFTRSAPADLPEEAIYPPCAIRFSNALTIPHADAPELRDLKLTQPERSACIGIEHEINRGAFGDHQLLGYPYGLEYSPLIEADNAMDDWRNIAYDSEERIALERDINRRWMLLLQVDSSGDLNMDWAGGGLLHFCIERERLSARDFNHIWLDMQFL